MSNIPPEGSFEDFSTPPRVSATRKGRGRNKVRASKAPKVPKDKVVGPRALSLQRLFAILCAIIALIAVFAVVSAKKPAIYIVETSQAVTPLQAVTKTNLVAVSIPKSSAVTTGAFTAGTAKAALKAALKAVGKLDPVISLPPGTVITPVFFSSLSHLEASMGLPVTNQLVSVNANVAGAVGGGLILGSKVEVVWEPTTDGPVVLAQNATVVSIKGSLAYFNSQNSGGLGSTATTLVTPLPGIYVLSTSAANAVAVGGAEADVNDNDGAIVLIFTGSTAAPKG
jgi:hypothetical protein